MNEGPTESAASGTQTGVGTTTSEDPDMRRFLRPQQHRGKQIQWLPPSPSPAAVMQFGLTIMDFGTWKDANFQYVWDHDWNYCVWAVEEVRRSSRSSMALKVFADWIKKKAQLEGVMVTRRT